MGSASMRTITSVLPDRQGPHPASATVENSDWNLECNAEPRDMDCPEILKILDEKALRHTLSELISQHIPTWAQALHSAAPPDSQDPQHETGHR